MNVVAVDTSSSVFHHQKYQSSISYVLSKLESNFHVIEWDTDFTTRKYLDTISSLYFLVHKKCSTMAESLIKILTLYSEPIHLLVFTDGVTDKSDIDRCVQLTKERKGTPVIHQVDWYFFETETHLDPKLLCIFEHVPQRIHINGKPIGTIDPHFTFDQLDYDYIRRDNSLKATLLWKLNSPDMDKTKLKRLLRDKCQSILQDAFKEVPSIDQYRESDNVADCVESLKQQSRHEAKYRFQCKLGELERLFQKFELLRHRSKNTVPKNYPRDYFRHFNSSETLLSLIVPKKGAAGKSALFKLEAQLLPYDVAFENSETIGIPLSTFPPYLLRCCKSRDPFSLLDYDLQKIVDSLQPYKVGHGYIFKDLRDEQGRLQNIYLLSNGQIDPEALIRHNNAALFLNNVPPGKDVLTHMIFLYILALKRFPELKERLFQEIRLLGDHSDYYLSLDPHTNPAIVAKLNTCFWYIARVCHVAFPNGPENVLKSLAFRSQHFVHFYRDVYDSQYNPPESLPVWLLWKTLAFDPLNIFPVLAMHVHSEKLKSERDPYRYILYRKPKATSEGTKKPEDRFPYLPFYRVRSDREFIPENSSYLAQLDLTKVLKVYRAFLNKTQPLSVCSESRPSKRRRTVEKGLDIFEEREESADVLGHVKIHLRTCHPLVTCPETGRYWKDCIGKYDLLKQSCLKVFMNYCMHHKKYPSGSDDLLVFQNRYLFRRQKKMPEFFPESIREKLDKVMVIFRGVMETYSCDEYLKRVKEYSDEKVRMEMERMYAYDDVSSENCVPETLDDVEKRRADIAELASRMR